MQRLFLTIISLCLFTVYSQAQKNFGAAITSDGAVSFEEALKQIEGVDSLNVKIKGTVAEVCQKKGCWMTLTSDAGQEMVVRFLDYGFFMPMDIAGREIIMDGYAFSEVTSVDMLKHYAEDANKSQEEIDAITEPREDLYFLAHGVILLDE